MSANTLLRQLPRRTATSTLRRTTAKSTTTTRSYATEETPKPNLGAAAAAGDKHAFRAQLYESTALRTKKERADRDRHAREREIRQSSGARNWGFTFVVLATGAVSYYFGTRNPREAEATSTLPLGSVPKLRHDTAPVNLEAAWTDFCAIVGRENVSTGGDEIAQHSGSDWSTHQHKESEKPFCIIYPKSTEEVAGIMKICHVRRIPVTPYSGGTSLEGHYTATRGGVCIDFGRMDKILSIHEADMDVVVQPAVGWEYLNEVLAEQGLFFPPDPGPGAMIGGMVGTGCSGTNAYRYGTMREWVLSLTVVLADGTVIKTRQRPRKSSAGYDLTKLFIGSEGTLGLVTEATLKVTTKPIATSVAVCAFPSIRAAAECVSNVVKDGIPIAAIEILDDVQMRCINASGSTSRQWTEAPTLFFKFSGTESACKEQIGLVQKIAKKHACKTFDFAESEQEKIDLWSARKEALWSVMALKREPSDHVWTGDVAVPISRLPDIIDATKADLEKSGLLGAIVGHVGDGNFHSILIYNDKERAKAEGVVHRMVKRAVEMEGTVSGEHGVGLVKRDYLEKELGETSVDLMRKIKLSLDPLCLLNCDKVVRVEQPGRGEVKEW